MLDGARAEDDASDWWSVQPLASSPVPNLQAEGRDWARNEIDSFVVANLREQGLAPSPEADPRVLCRRLYFDLKLVQLLVQCRTVDTENLGGGVLVATRFAHSGLNDFGSFTTG